MFGERVQEYEGVGGQRFEEEEEDKYRPRVEDPFAEVGGGQAWQGEGDPYEAIRKASREKEGNVRVSAAKADCLSCVHCLQSMERANPRPSY